jgi:twinkle protein
MIDTDNVVTFPLQQPAGLLSLSDMPERPPLKPWYSGFVEWRNKIALAPRTLSVVTGHPGHGKSSLMGQVWWNTVTINELGIVVATFENHPIPSYRKKLRQFWAGMPEYQMDDQQRKRADDHINRYYRFLVHPKERPSIDWILEWADKTPLNVLLIDPWNRLESQRDKNETETEYIAWCLTELRLFAMSHECHVMIVAHPAKRDAKFRDRVPFLEDISGSKNWDNMPDQGFVVHREKFWDSATGERQFDCKLYQLKTREEELGYPCCIPMRLDPKTQRFECTGERA